jgi:hypothetical protein
MEASYPRKPCSSKHFLEHCLREVIRSLFSLKWGVSYVCHCVQTCQRIQIPVNVKLSLSSVVYNAMESYGGTFLSCSIRWRRLVNFMLWAFTPGQRDQRIRGWDGWKPVLHTAETSCLLHLMVAQPCPNYANWDSRSGVGVRKVQFFQ